MSASPAGAARIEVRMPNWLGDALMARPFLRALRAATAGAHVVAIGPPAVLELLASDRAWDAARPWPAAPTPRAERADVAYVLPPSFRSALHAWRGGARCRVGYAGEGRSPLLTRALPRGSRGDRHLAFEYLALLGVDDVRALALPPLALPPGATAAGAALRSELGAAGAPLALLAPGARYGPAKRWPLERFAEVARALAVAGHVVAACGGAEDAEACGELARLAPGTRTLAGRTTLAATAALCAGAHVVVSNDSGLAHVAAAVGAPTVVVFGSTCSAWTAPLGPRVRIVQHPPVCAPCFARTCRVGYACLHAVGVREVLAAAERARSGEEAA